MLVLGIESSAHTFGAGVVEHGRVLANEKRMYKIGARGMIPARVAELHAKNAAGVIGDALDKASIAAKDIEGVGYTKGPGMGPCLQVGMLAAKTMAAGLRVPLIPVNHAVAHVEIAKKEAGLKKPIALYVSGGNSQILRLDGKPRRRYAVLGETFDIGVGNMLDAFARNIGLNPAWGSTVAREAKGGRYITMPYTVKGMDFSFTGLLTHASGLANERSKRDLCYSIQETAFAMLCEATERALLMTNSRELCVCGGVAQSGRLKEMLASMCREHGIRFGYAGNEYNADNGAMIAYVAEKLLEKGVRADLHDCDIKQRYRIEEAMVP